MCTKAVLSRYEPTPELGSKWSREEEEDNDDRAEENRLQFLEQQRTSSRALVRGVRNCRCPDCTGRDTRLRYDLNSIGATGEDL